MKKDHLFSLVKSLDAKEQRYFQLQSGFYHKKEGSLYFRLFQLLLEQKEYDEPALIAKLYPGKPQSQFHVLKNHLYHQLLESLIAFRGEKYTADKVDLLIRKSRLLQEKKLYKEADRFLARAAGLAERRDHFERLLIIYKQWKQLYAWILEVDKRALHIQRFWDKERMAIEQLSNLREMEWLSMRVFDLYYRKHYAKTKDEVAQYRELMQHPLLEKESLARSFSARVIYLNTHGLYEDAIGRKEQSLHFRSRLVSLYESRPDLIEEHFVQQLAASNNYLLALIHLGRYQEAQDALDHLARIPDLLNRKMKTEERVIWFRMYYSLQLEVHIRQGDFSMAKDMIPVVLSHFDRLGKALNPAFRFPFQYFFAYTCFVLREYDPALDFLTPLLHQLELKFRQELFRFARLLQIMIHFEKDDFDLLPSLQRSTRRYLRKSGTSFVLENAILRFLDKAPFADERQAFLSFRKELSALPEEVLSDQVLHHLDLLAWTESHIHKKPMAILLRDRPDHYR